MNSGDLERVLVAGREYFIELWALCGLEPLLCETPEDLYQVMRTGLDDDVALVLIEQQWYEGLPDLLRRRVDSSTKPSWIVFPSLKSSGE
ncbi:MAG: V-type ATP synthase subunit F [Thermovirgaceae bacterium]